MCSKRVSRDEMTIRRVRRDDVDSISAIYDQPGVIRGTNQLPHVMASRWDDRVKSIEERGVGLVIEVQATIVAYGVLLLHNTHHRRRHVGKIALAVHEAWQGRGVGTALMASLIDFADNWLDLKRLELQVFTDNAAAIRLYKKVGFAAEGTLRGWSYREGRYDDVLTMARLRPPLGNG